MTKIYIFLFVPKMKIKFLSLTFLFPPKGKDEIVLKSLDNREYI